MYGSGKFEGKEVGNTNDKSEDCRRGAYQKLADSSTHAFEAARHEALMCAVE
jgi:hypothetical protein